METELPAWVPGDNLPMNTPEPCSEAKFLEQLGPFDVSPLTDLLHNAPAWPAAAIGLSGLIVESEFTQEVAIMNGSDNPQCKYESAEKSCDAAKCAQTDATCINQQSCNPRC